MLSAKLEKRPLSVGYQIGFDSYNVMGRQHWIFADLLLRFINREKTNCISLLNPCRYSLLLGSYIHTERSALMQLEYLLLFALVFFIDSVIPGPAVAMVMSRGATVGVRRTIPFIAGLVVGDIFLFICALLGVVVLLNAFAPLFVFLKWLGIGYLLYLAYKLWNSKHAIQLRKTENTDTFKTFGLGLILPLANPRAVGFYVAVLPSFRRNCSCLGWHSSHIYLSGITGCTLCEKPTSKSLVESYCRRSNGRCCGYYRT